MLDPTLLSWIQIVEGEGCVKIAAVFFRVDLKEEEKKFVSKSDFWFWSKSETFSFTEPKKSEFEWGKQSIAAGRKRGFHTQESQESQSPSAVAASLQEKTWSQKIFVCCWNTLRCLFEFWSIKAF